jgi:hypothetical protein
MNAGFVEEMVPVVPDATEFRIPEPYLTFAESVTVTMIVVEEANTIMVFVANMELVIPIFQGTKIPDGVFVILDGQVHFAILNSIIVPMLQENIPW